LLFKAPDKKGQEISWSKEIINGAGHLRLQENPVLVLVRSTG
jgi:hypothetical protein